MAGAALASAASAGAAAPLGRSAAELGALAPAGECGERLHERAIATCADAGGEEAQRELFELHLRRGDMLQTLAELAGAAHDFARTKVVAERLGDDRRRARALIARQNLAEVLAHLTMSRGPHRPSRQ
ncbi:MAG: hypothetical protein HYV63_08045 [Candidatus Schekmanbacteria bacterium]|nr:hypothetical protein [Candidatus Schekmanbacteria bacterium]